MEQTKKRIFRLDDDAVEIAFVLDPEANIFLGDFPDFAECPRYTKNGYCWVNATNDDCPYAESGYGDCGSCPHFHCEQPRDLIGICKNELLRKEG
ncbi:MAG: hypothetical protein IKB86_07365 [Clostridia bacterium]|nr:hypothetical protein [Clostridia bacterium]